MLLIKNIYLYDPSSGKEGKADILIRDGVFTKIQEASDSPFPETLLQKNSSLPVTAPGAGRDSSETLPESGMPGGSEDAENGLRILDGTGLCAAPGLIDTHAHFRDPGYTWKEDLHTGSLAAAKGGYTSVILMANTNPSVDRPEILADILDRAAKEKIHIYSCVNVTTKMSGKEAVDFDALAAAGAAGFTDDGVPVMDEVLLKKAFDAAARLQLPVSLHEEDKNLISQNGINADRKSVV